MSRRSPVVCGIDFGTSNSGLAVPDGGASVRPIPLEADFTSIPTAVFFAAEDPQSTAFGRAAVAEYLDGTPGRLMRSLKSVLGSSLMEETTALGERSIRFDDVVMLFLRHVREQAERRLQMRLDAVVLGRPVRFVDDDVARDRAAQDTLARCAGRAGFSTVEFQYEPIAAALDYERTLGREELVLVVDVGGGTADFSVVRLGPSRRGKADRAPDLLANEGIHVAGTDFDARLHRHWVMPELGSRTRTPRGEPVPSSIYFDLSTWYRINFLYAPKFVGVLRELRTFYAEPRFHDRLLRVIDQRQGHRLLGMTEQAKIELSEHSRTRIGLDCIEPGLSVAAERRELEAELAALLARVVAVGKSAVAAAGVASSSVDTVYFTGGSSGMLALREAFRAAFPRSTQVKGDLFGSVTAGLAVEAGRRWS